MRFAIVNNARSLPSPGLTGSCPACGSLVIAKCGNQRVHHWAHHRDRVCDQWWESETEWHRCWKSAFPEEWQEVILTASTGEKHIADVRTPQGLTIEFQHSHLRPEERAARENFYGDMVWVIDGLRLRRDLPRFREGVRGFHCLKANGVYVHRFPAELIPSSWLTSKAPVFLDFGSGLSTPTPQTLVQRSLWRFQRGPSYAIVSRFSREELILAAREDQSSS